MADRSAVVVVTRSQATATEWAERRGLRRYVWPLAAAALSNDPAVEWVLLPDWALHPDARNLSEMFYRRLTGPAVRH